MDGPHTRYLVVAISVMLALSLVPTMGLVGAEEGSDSFDVTTELPEELLATDEQTLEVTVENTDENNPFDQPIVEIPETGPLSVDEESAVVDDGDGEPENRTTDTIDAENSASGEDAVIIEGQMAEIEPREEVTFKIDLEIETDGDIEVETPVYPLFNAPFESADPNWETASDEREALPVGTLEVDGVDDENVLVDGESDQLDDSEVELAADEYDVGAELPLADDEVVELEDVTVPADGTLSVEFSDTEDAEEPEVVAQTPSQADIVGLNSLLRDGNAEEPFERVFEFDIVTGGGDMVAGVEHPDDLDPFEEIDTDGDDSAVEVIDSPDPENATLVAIDTDDDDEIEIVYEGYKLGDVTLDGDVSGDDAAEIASSVASDETDELETLYTDVTGDDEISMADAMVIQQYADGDRDEEYDLKGGE